MFIWLFFFSSSDFKGSNSSTYFYKFTSCSSNSVSWDWAVNDISLIGTLLSTCWEGYSDISFILDFLLDGILVLLLYMLNEDPGLITGDVWMWMLLLVCFSPLDTHYFLKFWIAVFFYTFLVDVFCWDYRRDAYYWAIFLGEYGYDSWL